MKLIRVGPPGEEVPAMIAPDGDLRGLSDHIKDLNGETISPAGLSLIAGLDWKKLPNLRTQLQNTILTGICCITAHKS